MIGHNRELTLTSPKKFLRKNANFITRLSRRFLKQVLDEGEWYYVHFDSNNHQNIKNIVNISSEDTIIKDTYLLYLHEDQLEKLENITLVQKLIPEDKFSEDGGSIEDVDHFHVLLTPTAELLSHPNLYNVKRRDDSSTYIVKVDKDAKSDQKSFNKKKRAAVDHLTHLPWVKKVSTFSLIKAKNNLMTGYTQQNSNNILTDPSSGLRYLPRYVNNNNIRGEGQIVTIQDTPIDFYHAMFRDDSNSMQLNVRLNHRKFVYYGSTKSSLSEWSSQITESEHGTHVAGTTAGSSNCQNDAYVGTNLLNGNAPDAKILYAGGLNDVSAAQLGNLMNTFGSFISTNSWGVDGYVNQINQQYGELAYNNQDRLFLFAAGNEYSDGNFTVCDPGGSKNVLTIGAMGDFFNNYHDYTMRLQSGYSSTVSLRALIDADPWTVGVMSAQTSSPIVAIDPTLGDQCSKINSGKISVLYSSSTSAIEWIYKCQLSSTSGILYTSDVANIKNFIGQTVVLTDVTQINNSFAILHADYSSGGPGNKGILKPDIMTPGTRIISAKSKEYVNYNHGCQTTGGGDFTYMQGTSMATPNAAGAAALVREYFAKKGSPSNVQLDGATLRALLINSCKHPRYTKTPDVLFGHGIVDLSTILPFDNSFTVRITNPSNLPTVSEDGSVMATIQVYTNSKPLQITLSYFDTMLNRDSLIPLSRDLDLVVVSPSRRMYKGDHLESGDTQHFSTNEKVIINTNELEIGQYRIFVIAGEFVDGDMAPTQKFSLVASGNIDSGFITFSQATTCPCPMCRTVNPRKCQCRDGYIGDICQAKVTSTSQSKGSFNVPAMEIVRVKFTDNKEYKYVRAKSSNAGKQATVWFSNDCHVSLGGYDRYGEVGSLMNKQTKIDPSIKNVCIAIANPNYREATYEIELSNKSSNTGMIVGVVVAIVVVVIAALFFYFCCLKKGKCGKLQVGSS